MAGTLYVVGTPIGNLEDITYRAVRVLREVDTIACEDTRETRKLLERYGVGRPVVSYHEHNEAARARELLERLLAGESIALVSDAGMPLVSDPGYRIVMAAVEHGVAVTPVPGPSATLAALAAAGLPTDAFYFGGFLPAKTSQRQRALEALRDLPATLVFFETPHRVVEALADVERVLGARPVVAARELTKLHEEFVRGTAAEVRAAFADRGRVKGEITLLIGKAERPAEDETTLEEAVAAEMEGGLGRMDAIKAVARRRGLPKREVYDRMLAAPPPAVLAAGGVLRRTVRGQAQIAVVHRPKYDDWSLPKGKLDPGETLVEAACREVAEETGCEVKPGELAGSTVYMKDNTPKIAVYWHMTLQREGRFTPNEEIDQLVWLAPVDALRRLTHAGERRVLGGA
jgi:16S rRNA (cytidine1402-2'-O)-methyltransferase